MTVRYCRFLSLHLFSKMESGRAGFLLSKSATQGEL